MNTLHIKRRIIIIGIILCLLTLLLAVKLFIKQTNFSSYNRKIMHQSVRKIRIPARRGKIYTADYKTVADNRMTFELMLYIHEIRRPSRKQTVAAIEDAVTEMSLILRRENNISQKDILRHLIQSPGLPMKVFSGLSTKECAVINDYISDREGWALEIDAVRSYPMKDLAPHIIGYTRKGDPAAADDRREFSYYISDYVGKAGLEKAFDSIEMADFPTLRGLRGKPGYSLVQVDNMGYVRHSLVHEIAPLHGNHLLLNLDYNAQKKAQDILKHYNGAFVLVDADNGDIIAMASSPGYDLNKFSPRLEESYYKKLLKNPDKPLIPKAVSGTYTPGSIIKPLIGLAILENGKKAEEEVFCDGSTPIGNTKINCTSHRYGGHLYVDIFKALEKSCNDYFIEEGIKLGRDKICKFMQAAEFGKAPALEIDCAAGILPTVANKRRYHKSSRWTEFDTGLISIGQGMITISPLQAALYCAAIANGGKIYRPHLVRSILDQQGNTLFSRRIIVDSVIPASEENFEAVRQGMFQVVNSPSGSGRKAKIENHILYGKTGTAEIGSKKNRRQNTWFIAFVRHKGKTYAASLIIEEGQSGGSTCAPLMAEFFNDFLKAE